MGKEQGFQLTQKDLGAIGMPEWERDWVEYEATHLGRELTPELKGLVFNSQKPQASGEVLIPTEDQLKAASDQLAWPEYIQPDTLPSCDKGGHRQRSLANQPNHNGYWKSGGKGNGNNGNTERHDQNLSRLHGCYYHSVYYHHGVAQPKKK